MFVRDRECNCMGRISGLVAGACLFAACHTMGEGTQHMTGLLQNEDCTDFFYNQRFPSGQAEAITDQYVDVLAGAGLREEGVERVVLDTDRLVRRHRAVGLNAVLEAEELPAGVAGLDTSLTDVDAQALTHVEEG